VAVSSQSCSLGVEDRIAAVHVWVNLPLAANKDGFIGLDQKVLGMDGYFWR
jgi:hypothetical protein